MLSNTNESHCLLCGSSHLKVEDSIATDLVVENYAKAFDVDVESYFKPGENMSLVGCEDCGLLSYDPMPAGDAAFYEALQRLPWYYQDIKPEYHFAKTHVGAQDRVLEVGCGKGVFRSFLASSVDYHGLEFNQTAIDKATAQGLHVTAEPIQNHADTHPGEYDVVCHFQVLEHVSDPQGFLQACAKALKPGGKLIVAVPAEDSFLSLHRADWLNMPPHHVTRWKDSTLRHAFETQLGLAVETIWHEPLADYHRGWHRSIMANYGFKRLFGDQSRLDGKDLLSQLARRIIAKPRLQGWLARHGASRFEFAERGHSVCVVGIKRPL